MIPNRHTKCIVDLDNSQLSSLSHIKLIIIMLHNIFTQSKEKSILR